MFCFFIRGHPLLDASVGTGGLSPLSLPSDAAVLLTGPTALTPTSSARVRGDKHYVNSRNDFSNKTLNPKPESLCCQLR